MIKIPETGIYTQKNLGNFGDLAGSFNLNLSDTQGVLKVSPRLMENTAVTGVPFAFVYNDKIGKWHAGIQGIGMFVGGANCSVAFAADEATTPPTFQNDRPDLAVFSISGTSFTYGMTNELYKLAEAGGSWSTIGTLGGSTNGAPLLNFKGRLYFCFAQNKMYSSDGATLTTSSTNTIDLSGYQRQFINCGVAGEKYIYLGTWTTSPSKKCLVYEWDGVNSTPTNVYEVDAQAVLAIVERFGVPWLLDSHGIWRALNGRHFEGITRLPFKKNKMLPICDGQGQNQICHYNGIVIDGDRVLMNINAKYADGTTDPLVASGLWEFNDLNGLFHHASPSAWVYGTTTEANDYGASRISKIGAIRKAPHATYAADGDLLVGVTYYSNATTEVKSIQVNNLNDSIQKAGHFITTKKFSKNINDGWQKIYLRFKKFLTATDKFAIKARVKEDTPTEATVTFNSSTTQFTVPTSSFTTAPVVGDEVTILNGKGAGLAAHITAITTSAPNYIITIDEAVVGATTQTAKARFETWKKVFSYSAQTDEFIKPPLPSELLGTSIYIQFKVWMLWTGDDELYDTIISSDVNEAIE